MQKQEQQQREPEPVEKEPETKPGTACGNPEPLTAEDKEKKKAEEARLQRQNRKNTVMLGAILSAAGVAVSVLVLIANKIMGIERWQNAVFRASAALLLAAALGAAVFGAVWLYYILLDKEPGASKRFYMDDTDDSVRVEDVVKNYMQGHKCYNIYSLQAFKSITGSVRKMGLFYQVSVENARTAFALAVTFCVFGLALFTVSFIYGWVGHFSDELTKSGLIASAASELFAGTALLVHKSSMAQFNRYYDALHDNEMMLVAVTLAEHMTDGPVSKPGNEGTANTPQPAKETKAAQGAAAGAQLCGHMAAGSVTKNDALMKIIEGCVKFMTDTNCSGATDKAEKKETNAAGSAGANAQTPPVASVG